MRCWGRYLGLKGNSRGLEKSIDEPDDRHCSPNLIRVVESKRMISAKHKKRMRGKRNR
jgi:hypothetical protein